MESAEACLCLVMLSINNNDYVHGITFAVPGF